MYADERVRLVFREECGPDRLVTVWVRGEITEDMLSGLVGFVERQRRRIAAKPPRSMPKQTINARGYILSGEIAPCDTCHKPTDVNLLDMKDDGTGDFDIAECEACYGPGWRPAFTTNEDEAVF